MEKTPQPSSPANAAFNQIGIEVLAANNALNCLKKSNPALECELSQISQHLWEIDRLSTLIQDAMETPHGLTEEFDGTFVTHKAE